MSIRDLGSRRGHSYHAKEEGGLVGLQRGLGVECVVAMTAVGQCRNHGGCAQLLDELEKRIRWALQGHG